MKIFISWSGERSLAVARALQNWLPLVIQTIKPCMSKEFEKGRLWTVELARELADADFGIACLTPQNLAAPWLLFESGALFDRLATYLFDISSVDLTEPLSHFQHTQAAHVDENRRLIASINARSKSPLDPMALNAAFELCWPILQKELQTIPGPKSPPKELSRTERMIEETLLLSREIARQQVSMGRLRQIVMTLQMMGLPVSNEIWAKINAGVGLAEEIYPDVRVFRQPDEE